jgi:hypothetical protein
VEGEEALTGILYIVASSFELLYGYMRILWKEYNIPVVVTHSRRPRFATRSVRKQTGSGCAVSMLVREDECAAVAEVEGQV